MKIGIFTTLFFFSMLFEGCDTKTSPKVSEPAKTDSVEEYGKVIDSIDAVCDQMPDSTSSLYYKKMGRKMLLYATVAYPCPQANISAKNAEEATVAKYLALQVSNHIEKTNLYFSGDYDWAYLEEFCTKRFLNELNENLKMGIGLTLDPIMGINDIGTRHLISVESIELKGNKAVELIRFGDLQRNGIVIHQRKAVMAQENGKWMIDCFLQE